MVLASANFWTNRNHLQSNLPHEVEHHEVRAHHALQSKVSICASYSFLWFGRRTRQFELSV